MSERIVLIKNMGNSGGAWLMKILNRHPNIIMFQELNQVLRLRYDTSGKKTVEYPDVFYDVKIAQRSSDLKGFLFDSRTQCEIAFRFLLQMYSVRQEEVIGLIKCFDTKVIEDCKNVSGSVKVIQVLRNPIAIIDFYTSQVSFRQIAFHDSYEISFKKHVELFYNRCLDFWLKSEEGQRIVRLEDMNISLKNKTSFFKNTMESIFELEWSDKFIEDIREMGYGDDGSQNKAIFDNWEDWKKEYFRGYFKDIMAKIGYELR